MTTKKRTRPVKRDTAKTMTQKLGATALKVTPMHRPRGYRIKGSAASPASR